MTRFALFLVRRLRPGSWADRIVQVFALGGIGQALLTAVKAGDLMVTVGTVLVAVILISVVNLIADIGQAILDPRVRLY